MALRFNRSQYMKMRLVGWTSLDAQHAESTVFSQSGSSGHQMMGWQFGV